MLMIDILMLIGCSRSEWSEMILFGNNIETSADQMQMLCFDAALGFGFVVHLQFIEHRFQRTIL